MKRDNFRSLIIFGKKYKIQYKKDLKHYGELENKVCKIIISSKIKGSERKQTLLHEIIHAIGDSNINIKTLHEVQIEQLCLGLLSFFSENKEITKWLIKK